jgi:hypothetical protein
MLTLVARWKTVRPEAGWTNPPTGAPGEAVPHTGQRPLPPRCPDAAQERLAANAVVVGGPHAPQFHAGVGEGGGDLP